VKPGGYIELHESDIIGPRSDDNTHLRAHGILRYSTLLGEAAKSNGLDMNVGPSLAGLLREAGFIDVVEKPFKVPLGTWCKNPGHKTLGRWFLEVARYGYESYGLAAFTRFGGLKLEEAENVIDKAMDDCSDRTLHVYYVL
jgi:hypothetical protein